MKQLLAIAALVACAHASLFVQQADNSATILYTAGGNGGSNPGPLASALYTDSLGYGYQGNAYPTYGIRYYNGQTRRFSPTGNWLMVTDPISNNYGDYNAPIFSIITGATTTTQGTATTVQIPRNPFSTFHSVVISVGPDAVWTQPGDIVIFQPNPATGNTLSSYNPLDIFGYNLGTGTNSLQTNNIPNVNGWICLGWNVITLNLAADQQQYFGNTNTMGTTGVGSTGTVNTNGYRARGAYCLVSESNVVAQVDLSPGASYPWPQRSLVNRLDALSSEPSEFGFVGLA